MRKAALDGTMETAMATRIVGIGASAGGVEALKTFFGSMPSDTGMTFLVVLHLAPDHESLLADILRGSTRMPVVQATDGMDVTPNRIYVIPPGAALTFADNRLAVHGQAGLKRHPFVVDLLFSSLAVALGDNAVGIVLSGTGNDGALGLKAIRDGGGIAMAQGPNGGATYFDGMPNAAIAVGAVDMFLPVGEMAERLLHLVACSPPPVMTPPRRDRPPTWTGIGQPSAPSCATSSGTTSAAISSRPFSAACSGACDCLTSASTTTFGT
jgi:chemotaxis response regulator CheB